MFCQTGLASCWYPWLWALSSCHAAVMLYSAPHSHHLQLTAGWLCRASFTTQCSRSCAVSTMHCSIPPDESHAAMHLAQVLLISSLTPFPITGTCCSGAALVSQTCSLPVQEPKAVQADTPDKVHIEKVISSRDVKNKQCFISREHAHQLIRLCPEGLVPPVCPSAASSDCLSSASFRYRIPVCMFTSALLRWVGT